MLCLGLQTLTCELLAYVLFFFGRIEKVEKERNLGAQCKKNGWSDWFGELEDIEKVLKEHRDAESRCSMKSH